MTEIRENMLKVKRMISDVEIILGKREGETELVNQLIDAQNLLTYCMSRLENAIVPPCKVGDTVYMPFIENNLKELIPKAEPLKVKGVAIMEHIPEGIIRTKQRTQCLDFKFTDFGARVFYNASEALVQAEKALAERQGKMTYQNAIGAIRNACNWNGSGQYTSDELAEAKEIVCEATEKQIPKKPAVFKDYSQGRYTVAFCPNCKKLLGLLNMAKTDERCVKCGQALDWSDTE